MAVLNFILNSWKGKLILLCNRVYKIGRSIGDQEIGLIIEEDKTVSRLHAEILMKYDENKCVSYFIIKEFQSIFF